MKHILSDEQLVQCFVDTQHPQFFDRLYKRYFPKVYRLCTTVAETSFEAEDMAQEIFLKVFTRIHTFNGRSQFSTWLHTLTRNYCIDRRRITLKNTQLLQEYMAQQAILEAPLDSAWPYSPTDDQFHYLAMALSHLSPDDQRLLNRKYEQLLTVAEIARLDKCTLSAVKMRLLRARQRLHQAYQQTYQH